MTYIFFIYGLAFFVLGFAIFLYPKKDSAFRLAKLLNLIACFGVLHGINEWLDLFILIGKPPVTTVLDIFRMLTLPLSFIFLVHFGAKGIALRKNKKYVLITPLAFIIWAAVFWFGSHTSLMWDVWSRYLLCIPGGLLTGYALTLQFSEFEKTKMPGVLQNLKLATAVFFFYAVIAGLFVPPADFFPASVFNYTVFTAKVGVPIQVFRSICAVILAYNFTRVLSIFHWETREALRQSELRFRTIASESPVILLISDANHVITFIEGKGLDTLKLDPKDVLGRKVADVFGDIKQLRESSDRALRGEEIVTTLEIKDSIFEVCVSPLRDVDGEISSIIKVFVDITPRVAVQAEFEKYRDEMSKYKQLAELGTLSNKMVQEIKEPLAVSRVFLNKALSNVKTPGETEQITRNIKESLAEVSKAISAIDKFYNSAQITPKPTAEPIDLSQIVRRIIAVFAERAQRNKLQLIPTGIDIVPCMFINQRELEQVFFVMIQNAIDSADGKEPCSLMINCEIRDNNICLQFKDTCGGIASENMDNLFEPFFEPVKEGMSPSLGLAIVKRIVTAYNGDIRVENEAGLGTTFYITLPIEQVY